MRTAWRSQPSLAGADRLFLVLPVATFFATVTLYVVQAIVGEQVAVEAYLLAVISRDRCSVGPGSVNVPVSVASGVR